MGRSELNQRVLRSLVQPRFLRFFLLSVMITEDTLIASLQDLPEKFTLDELFDRAILLEKIDRAMAQVAAGEVYTTEEARQKLKEWSK